ncbi:hypothetical protein BGW39_006326 [Mortierella sp. 14UC]|nr:hypothetical protein BGW39_006326 [Mortierella sp. 14UC]
MYKRGAFGNWRGRGGGQDETPGHGQGRGRGRGQDEKTGQGQGWGQGRGIGQGDRGGFNTPRGRGASADAGGHASLDDQQGGSSRGRGRGNSGRGGFDTSQGGTNGWSNGQGDRGRVGFIVSRGDSGGWGRGRGGTEGGDGSWNGFSDQERANILSSRKGTIHISSEGTDDLITPLTSGAQIGLAFQVLQQSGLGALRTPLQIRLFLQSCLLNLSNHHKVDTSEVFYNLASGKGLAKLRHIMEQPVSIEVTDETTSSKVSFQNVVLPLVGLLTRQSICQTVLRSESNLIYGLVKELTQEFLELAVLTNMRSLLDRQRQQGQDQDTISSSVTFPCALLAIVRLFYQTLTRFPDSASKLDHLIKNLATLVDQCLQQSERREPQQVHLNSILGMEIQQLSRITRDIIITHERSQPRPWQMLLTPSDIPFDGPGKLALQGQRHDNDHAMIGNIDLFPTIDEVLCRDEPYLPISNKDLSAHFLPSGWSRHLDDHFRLYRHDMMELLCSGTQAFVELLEKTDRHNTQDYLDPSELARQFDNNKNLNVYTNVQFLNIPTNDQYPGSTRISFDQPNKVQGLDQENREDFWLRARGRLQYGDIVCFVRRSKAQADQDLHRCQVMFALVKTKDIAELSESESIAYSSVFFTDSASYSTVFAPQQSLPSNDESWFLLECPRSLFEIYRVVLRALQTILPATMPFRKYIAPTDEDTAELLNSPVASAIGRPFYTTTPGFKFDLSVLMQNGQACELDVGDALSVDRAATTLREHSSLDDAQVSTLLEALQRELSLISGLPGSGKTKIGVDLMKVLLHNKQAMSCGPILVISYRNHALDQFLELLLDQGYNKIARLGSNSRSQRLDDYNLMTLIENQSKDKPYAVKRVQGRAWKTSNGASKAIQDLTLALQSGYFDWKLVKEHLEFTNPSLCRQFEGTSRAPAVWKDDGRYESSNALSAGKESYERWATGKDLEEKRALNRHVDEQERSEPQPANTIPAFGQDRGENVAKDWNEASVSDRPLSLLGGDVWSMSMAERRRLIEHWSPEITQLIEMELEQHHQLLRSIDESKLRANDESGRLILSEMDVIGMTTSGSARYHALLESVAPKIILCEEAGEVLESQILTALSPSTQQLILIGDYLQLRPYVQNHNLSSQSSFGKKYSLDMSLFERLATSKVNPLPVSGLTIQHRMGSEISSIVRNTLYPTLEDDSSVVSHPDVDGMSSNLFFMDHGHPEDTRGLFDSQFFSNTFEIEMIGALAIHLTQNGYNQPGDIVILTPYLGQLNKIFNHLLARLVAQGEEAKIVLISLVRSDARSGDEDVAGSHDFLTLPNLANVLLTRAKHGMFIIGNGGVMAQPGHGVWPAIMSELEQSGRVGPGLPIACKNHPETKTTVSSPKDLEAAAPDGGCTLPCGIALPCGHLCPRCCHPDDPQHLLVKCRETCLRPQSECDHACQKLCGEDCRGCIVTVPPWKLPCGHELESPKCWQLTDPAVIKCTAKVDRTLASCGHTSTVACYQITAGILCIERCTSVRKDGRPCELMCHGSSPCDPCIEKCIVSCAHTSHSHERETLCKPCCLDCVWECKHRGRCTLPCAAPCDRLPCEERCDKELSCGHRCPSVCGEACPPARFCPECCKSTSTTEVLDRTRILRLDEMDLNNDPILVPPCGHPIAVSTMDALMYLDGHYQKQLDESLGTESYVALKALQDGFCARPQVNCNVCLEPIGSSFLRYGRPVKHKRLYLLMQEFRRTHFRKQCIDDQKRAMDAVNSLDAAEDGLLSAIAKFKAPPCPAQPQLTGRRIRVQDGVLVGDLGGITSLYKIPWRHQTAWEAAITPAKDILALLGQSPVERTPLKEVATILASKSQALGPGSPWKRMDPYGLPSQDTRSSSNSSPTKEDMSQAVRILGLEHILGPRGQYVKQRQLTNTNLLSRIAIHVFKLAFSAMDAASAESGWFWFLGDLVECCQAFYYGFKTTALLKHGHQSSDMASIAAQLVVMGFGEKLSCLTARPLGGKQSNEEFQQALEEIEQAFLAEVNEQRRDGGFGVKHEVKISRIEKEMEVLVQRAKRQGDKAQQLELNEMKEW